MRKILVANRGEIALRIIRAGRELGLATVAVYSTVDEGSLHVREADEAVCIGPAHARDSYLNIAAIIEAARTTGADAVHPGYGFLAENARFAAACADGGLTFVGPPAGVIAELGDKVAARRVAQDAGVPTVPGADRIDSSRDALEAGRRIGYPVMVKAAAGGGGRGIRAVHTPEDLAATVEKASREAEAAFGDAALYLEKLLVAARHVEVQVLGDLHGQVVHCFERECSLQRRRQKLLEESPSPALSPEMREAMADAAVRIGRAIGYTSAGTVEFLVHDGTFYFIEMNARIQVEHPVTEVVTGIDLVKEQLLVAEGERLDVDQDAIALTGWGIEFRINAEDPARDFLPSPGEVTAIDIPGGPVVRVDTALYEGCTVLPFYDSLIAKLIVHGRTRDEAIARGRRALQELRIEGIETTIPFHLDLIGDPSFLAGAYHVTFVDERATPRGSELLSE